LTIQGSGGAAMASQDDVLASPQGWEDVLALALTQVHTPTWHRAMVSRYFLEHILISLKTTNVALCFKDIEFRTARFCKEIPCKN
jgi:hypothetical protein